MRSALCTFSSFLIPATFSTFCWTQPQPCVISYCCLPWVFTLPSHTSNEQENTRPASEESCLAWELSLHRQSGFSDLLAGERLGVPPQEGFIGSESLRGFTNKNRIFIDRKTALKPQEKNSQPFSRYVFFQFSKVILFGGLVCDCAAILFHFQFSKNAWSLCLVCGH